MNYTFPEWPNTIIKNPTITVNGQVGTIVKENIPQDETFVDIHVVNDGFDGSPRLVGDTAPTDWTMESIQIWVANELKKYEVD